MEGMITAQSEECILFGAKSEGQTDPNFTYIDILCLPQTEIARLVQNTAFLSQV